MLLARLVRPLAVCLALTLPALTLRATGTHPAAVLALVLFGAAVVAASFVLAWAAEAAQVDISGGLAIAILAVIAVLPEYAVDLYFAYKAGSDPSYVPFAAANMTGSNRLLLGLGWSLVVLVGLVVAGAPDRPDGPRAGARLRLPGRARLPRRSPRWSPSPSRPPGRSRSARVRAARLLRVLPLAGGPGRGRGA